MKPKAPRKLPAAKAPISERDQLVRLYRTSQKYMGNLYQAAKKGDRRLAQQLVSIACGFTRCVEHLYEEKPRLVIELTKGADEFPVLQSWDQECNNKRQEMIRSLELGAALPLKATRKRDEFYRRLIEHHIPCLGFDLFANGGVIAPLTPEAKVCREWAGRIADQSYPVTSKIRMPDCPAKDARASEVPDGIDPVDWEFALGYAKHAHKVANRSESVPPRIGTEIDEFNKGFRQRARSRMSFTHFRSGFIDLVASRLENGAKNSPWFFGGKVGLRMKNLNTMKTGKIKQHGEKLKKFRVGAG